METVHTRSFGSLRSAGSRRRRGSDRQRRQPILVGALSSVLLLHAAGCQGLDWGDEPASPTPTPTGDDDLETPTPTAQDTRSIDLSAGPWLFALGTRAATQHSGPAPAGTDWDLRFDGTTLHLNGGESGDGDAWGLGPVGFGEADYEALTDHTEVVGPVVYYDEFESVLSSWYAYIVSGAAHGVYSRYHVYGIVVDATHSYKLQILDYYDDVNGSLESGMITFRWADLDADAPLLGTIDARAGGAHAEDDDPRNKYTYWSFATGSVVELSDEQASSSLAWDLAFKRYYVKLNGGVSGPKGVKGYDFQADRAETDSEIRSFTPESELPEFEAADSDTLTGPLTEDRIGSIVQQAYTVGEAGTLIPSGVVFVLGNASGGSTFKFLVTGLELDVQGNPTRVVFRSAEID